MAILHSDQLRLSQVFGGNLRQGVGIAVITDAIVAAGDTPDLLKAGVAAVKVHSDTIRLQDTIARAIDYGTYSAEITSALLNPLTTTDGLINLTQQAGLANYGIRVVE